MYDGLHKSALASLTHTHREARCPPPRRSSPTACGPMHQFESRICRVRISVGSLGVHTLITYGLPLIQFASVLIHVGSPSVSKLVCLRKCRGQQSCRSPKVGWKCQPSTSRSAIIPSIDQNSDAHRRCRLRYLCPWPSVADQRRRVSAVRCRTCANSRKYRCII